MLLLSLTTLFVVLFQSVSAETLPCNGYHLIYEAYPDYSYDTTDGSGYIYRYQGQYTTTALCTVNFPSSAGGHKCKLHFSVGPSGYVDTSPGYSRSGQVFTLGSPAISSATWNGRGPAYRDQHLGTFINLAVGTEADWVGGNAIFNCPDKPTGFEVAPTGDSMYAYWPAPYGLSVEIL